jgi:hypothetical protein
MKGIRTIAVYLPQFHPIPENNEWWGEGFTEWTNVAKARPLFKGHYQPRLPADLGFYDLRLPQARQAQADMASEYGIYGFCYYYYWFNGRRLLERPLDEVLKSGKPDFPFMVCWANENWTRRWDGGEDKILIRQDYSKDNPARLFHSLYPAFNDRRYIRVYDKPVFAIYNVSLIPDHYEFISRFREEALKKNLDIYLLSFEGFNRTGATNFPEGFDASVEFQPFGESLRLYKSYFLENKAIKHLLKRLEGRFLKTLGLRREYEKMWAKYFHRINYKDYVDFIIQTYRYPDDYKRYPGVSPFWDNSARTGKRATVFLNESPEKYGEWLRFHKDNFTPFSEEENIIFINAWNEWAEGNHLEPCSRWGRKYLEFTRQAIK